jgi:hypothetical protein
VGSCLRRGSYSTRDIRCARIRAIERDRLVVYVRIAGRGNEDRPVSFCRYHLERLNDGVGCLVLLPSLSFNDFCPLSYLQNKLVAVLVVVEQLVEDSGCRHKLHVLMGLCGPAE